MTDLRARLADAIYGHFLWSLRDRAERIADLLLSQDDIAIVELPKPVVANDWDWCAVLPGGHIDDLITESGLLTTDEARSKAAALLAAAQAAERATE